MHLEANQIEKLLIDLVEQLKIQRATVAVAESCTGGLVSHLLTNIPGSSAVFKAGVVAYDNVIKERMLGVKATTLKAVGAVSQATVCEMACGVREKIQTTYGLATSGIAGPDGGTSEKPVGTIWIAIATENACYSKKLSLDYDREGNKWASAYRLLLMLLQCLQGSLEITEG